MIPQQPFISICIPSYKNVDYLKRLLDSIKEQTFKDIEVIISDDSPDDAVSEFIKAYTFNYSLKYFKNSPSLGTPANWNEAIRNAKGKWIKIMHDDDWFATNNALQVYHNYVTKYPEVNFFYGAYYNVNLQNNKAVQVKNSLLDKLLLRLSPLNLFRKNTVGNPSCSFIKNENFLFYDEQLKWVVDFDFSISILLKFKKYKYIPEYLIKVGLGSEQVTESCFRNPVVEIPENFILLEKHGIQILKNIIVYDYYWRLFRNLNITKESEILQYYPAAVINSYVKKMLHCQDRVSSKLLHNGIVSKLLMAFTYCRSVLFK